MGRRVYACTTSDNSFMLAGTIVAELPMTTDSDLTDLMHNYGTATFKLAINDPACPEDWEELVEPIKMGVVVVNDELTRPEWSGFINGVPVISGEGTRTINCVSYEGYLNLRHVPDIAFQTMDQLAWVKHLIDRMNADHRGMGITCEFTPSGISRSKKFLQSDWKTYLETINELAEMEDGFEWDLEVEWTDENWTRIKKTLRPKYKNVGRVTNTPNISFEYPGNIQVFEYEKYYNEGQFATHLIVTGDGSGVKQVKSAEQVDTVKESLIGGYPRVEVKEHVSGIEYANDATTLAKGKAKGYHNPPVAIQITLDSSLTENDIKKGDSAYISIDSTELKLNAVWRVTALSTDNDGNIKPTLSPMTDGSKKFPLIPGDPSNPKREKDAADSEADYSNPISKGWEVPKPDGSGSWTFDPENGYGFEDSDGNWEGIGGDAGIGHRMQVASYDAITFRTFVYEIGDPSTTYPAWNSSGVHLTPGDYVATVKSTSEAEGKLIVSRERVDYEDPTTYTKHRVHTDYPIDVTPYGLAQGSAFVDVFNAFSTGNHAVILDDNNSSGTGYDIYNPQTGVAATMGIPTGYTRMVRGINIFESVGYRWFTNNAASPTPYPFMKDPNAVGGWTKLDGLPVTPDVQMTGVWQPSSVNGEVFVEPMVGVTRIPAYKLQNGFLPVNTTLWRKHSSLAQMTPWHTFAFYLPVPGGLNNDTYTNIFPLTKLYVNGRHAFISVKVDAVIYTSGYVSTGENLFYIDLLDPTLTPVSMSTNGFTGYLGIPRSNWNTATLRISSDGVLYATDAGVLYSRGLTDTQGRNVLFETNPGTGLYAYPQRDQLTERYYICGGYVESTVNGTQYYANSVYEVYMSNSSVGKLTQPGTSGPAQNGSVTIPRQMPDGSVMFYFRRDSTSTTGAVGWQLNLYTAGEPQW